MSLCQRNGDTSSLKIGLDLLLCRQKKKIAYSVQDKQLYQLYLLAVKFNKRDVDGIDVLFSSEIINLF